MNLGDEGKTSVLLALLQSNREEIRHWQNIVASASFWFNAGLLAVTSSFYSASDISDGKWIIVPGMIALSAFYWYLLWFARKSAKLETNQGQTTVS